jgi:hypothetical protein
MSKLAKMLNARAKAWAAQRLEEIARSDLHDDLLGSGIQAAPDGYAPRSIEQVTLIVYGWHNVQPGPMSWVFTSAGDAMGAAKAMRNAVSWAIVRGSIAFAQLDEARARGDVMLEHGG